MFKMSETSSTILEDLITDLLLDTVSFHSSNTRSLILNKSRETEKKSCGKTRRKVPER